MAVSAAEWTPHSCDVCINLDPIKVSPFFRYVYLTVIYYHIQNYDKFELIGTGGFAKVYRGIRLCDSFDVAIKIVCILQFRNSIIKEVVFQMDKQQLKLKNAQSRVNEEVQIHYRLRNSAIVKVRNK